MIFYFSHFMKVWVLPPGMNLLLIMIGLLLFSYRPKLAKTIILASLVSLWALSTPLIAQIFADSLQYQYDTITANNIKKDHAAIVVLDAGANEKAPEYESPAVSPATLQRLKYAAYLHKKTGVPILVSGNNPNYPDFNEAANMAKALKEYFGIEARWQEALGTTTKEEGVYTTDILKKDHISRIYLVTQAIHIPRSMYAFVNRGIEVIPAPTGYLYTSYHVGKISVLLPTIESLRISIAALHEHVGLIWYRILK